MKRILASLMAVTVMFLCLTGCQKGQNSSAVPNLKWYVPIETTNANNDAVFAKANEYVKQKLNVNLELMPLDFGNYEAKMQVLNASGEVFDIVFTSNWSNNYYQNISKGTLIELDEMIKTNAPKLQSEIPQDLWDGVKVDGKIYGIPNQQTSARAPCFLIAKQNIKSLNLNVSEYENLEDNYSVYMSALEKYLTLQKEVGGTYSRLNQMWIDGSNMFGLEEILGSSLPGAIRFKSNEPTKVINQYESQEFKDYITARRRWSETGLIPPQGGDGRNLGQYLGEGKVYPQVDREPTYKPGIEIQAAIAPLKCESYTLIKTVPLLSSGGITSTMNGISATSKNPKLAIKVLELVNTDKELYNLLSFGIENVNYKKVGDNRIEKIPTTKYECPNWAIGSVYNSYLLPGQEDNIWDVTKDINAKAIKSPLLGFSPNLESLKPQIAGCKAAIDEYLTVLDAGSVDVDKAYNEFIKKLNDAGVNKIITEIQAQVDLWLTSK